MTAKAPLYTIRSAVLMFLLLPFLIQAQELKYQFRQYTPNDGLPSSEAHCILNDSKNFLWIATDHGVCRYDGYYFETFNLPDNSVLSLYEDYKKRIWAITFSRQLFIYENGRFYPYKYNDVIARLHRGGVLSRVYVDPDETVLLVSQYGGKLTIDSSGNVMNDFEVSDHLIYKSYRINTGEYVTYTRSANLSNREHTSSTLEISVNGKDFFFKMKSLLPGRKTNIEPLQNGSFLFYSGDFLLKITGRNVVEKKIGAEILDLFEDQDGQLWVATLRAGFFILDKDLTIKEHYLDGLTVTSIEKDYEGGMWFTSTSQGVFYLRTTMVRNLALNKGFFNYPFTVLASEKDSVIWIGSVSENLYRYIPGSKIETIQLPVTRIYDILPDWRKNKVYVSADFPGASKIKAYKTKQFRPYEIIPVFGQTKLIRNGSGFIVGTSYGINDNDTLLLNQVLRVSAIYLDRFNRLLIGHQSGLGYVKNRMVVPYDSSKKILQSRITDISEYGSKYLCLGTRGNGLIIISDDEFYQLTEKEGLASNNIRKIYIDDDCIWLATNKGISRLIISFSPLKFSLGNINAQDGLLSNEINDILRVANQLYISSNAGLSILDTRIFSKEKVQKIPFYISSLRINGEQVNHLKEYSLTYQQRKLQVSYSALSYRNNGNMLYRYRLSKPGAAWSYTSDREIIIDPVPFGKYTLEIQTKTKGGDWSDKNQLSISFNVQQAFWQTTLFILVTTLLGAGVIFGIIRWRIKIILKKKDEKLALNKKLVEMEMKALRAQMNPHFIFNVLNSIQYYVVFNDAVSAQHYLSKFARLVRLTLDNSRVTFVTLESELTLLKLYLELENLRFEHKFHYEIDVDPDIDKRQVVVPNLLLQPYVENAIKHGFRGRGESFLSIKLQRMAGKIICTITDNGVGRMEAAKTSGLKKEAHTSTGTLIIKDKIEALKTHYNYHLSSNTVDLVEDGKVKGTQIILEIPDSKPEP